MYHTPFSCSASTVVRIFLIFLCRFYLYKLPHPHHTSPEEGLKYLYMDAESKGWVDGKTLINDTRSAVGRTVGPLYEVLYSFLSL